MSRISHFVWAAMMSLLLATSLTSVIAAKAPPPNPAPSSDRIFAGQSESLQRRRRQEGP